MGPLFEVNLQQSGMAVYAEIVKINWQFCIWTKTFDGVYDQQPQRGPTDENLGFVTTYDARLACHSHIWAPTRSTKLQWRWSHWLRLGLVWAVGPAGAGADRNDHLHGAVGGLAAVAVGIPLRTHGMGLACTELR